MGLTAARLRGIKESKGDLLILVDDDNVLSPNDLELAISTQHKFPYLGAYGAGLLKPEFESQPPPKLADKISLLALRSNRGALWSNNFGDWACRPVGAGLCVVRKVAEGFSQVIEQLRVTALLGRRRQQLFYGEDDLFFRAAVRTGLGFGVFPDLRMKHLISRAGRLKREYFIRLIRDNAYSHGVLRFLLEGNMPHQFNPTHYLHVLLHAVRNDWFSMQCQWQSQKASISRRNSFPQIAWSL